LVRLLYTHVLSRWIFTRESKSDACPSISRRCRGEENEARVTSAGSKVLCPFKKVVVTVDVDLLKQKYFSHAIRAARCGHLTEKFIAFLMRANALDVH
jgi:hypothetical protein